MRWTDKCNFQDYLLKISRLHGRSIYLARANVLTRTCVLEQGVGLSIHVSILTRQHHITCWHFVPTSRIVDLRCQPLLEIHETKFQTDGHLLPIANRRHGGGEVRSLLVSQRFKERRVYP